MPGPHFPALKLNMERYSESLCIVSEYGYFSRSHRGVVKGHTNI